MIDIRDMFQWDRYITPLIAPIFFWIATLVALMAGVFGFTSGVLSRSLYSSASGYNAPDVQIHGHA
jgi:hypothetical protein